MTHNYSGYLPVKSSPHVGKYVADVVCVEHIEATFAEICILQMDKTELAVKKRPGLKKGQTNNPNGRPVGSTNKVSRPVKERIGKFVEENFDEYVNDMRQLEPRDRVKAMTELFKLLVPRPLSDEEKDGVNKLYGGLAHLFGQKDDAQG